MVLRKRSPFIPSSPWSTCLKLYACKVLLESFSPPTTFICSGYRIGVQGGALGAHACDDETQKDRWILTYAQEFGVYIHSFLKDMECLLYARLCSSQWRHNEERSRGSPCSCAAPFLGAMWHADTAQIHFLILRATFRALGNQIPVDVISHDWVGVHCSPCEN